MSVTVTLVSDGLLSLAEHKAVMSDKKLKFVHDMKYFNQFKRKLNEYNECY